MDEWMNEWMNEWVDGWMHRRMDGRIDEYRKSLLTCMMDVISIFLGVHRALLEPLNTPSGSLLVAAVF